MARKIEIKARIESVESEARGGHPPFAPDLPRDQAPAGDMKLGCICGCFNRAFDEDNGPDRLLSSTARPCAELQDIHFPKVKPWIEAAEAPRGD